MAKKKKAMQSTNAKEQGSTGGSDELVEDEAVVDTEGESEDSATFNKQEDEVTRRMIMRRKLEQYLEERRLKKELGDDFDS